MQIPKYFATQNSNKLREVNQILGVAMEHVALDLAEPQSLDLNEIVQAKARDAYQKFGQPVLVEDTGLFFEAWKGLPGPFIKWFLQTLGAAGILKTFENEQNRGAFARAIFAFFDGKDCHTFTGEVHGSIAKEIPKQAELGGFGWDPIFIPEGFEQTFAQMSAEQKNSVSHRYRALIDLKKYL